MLERARSPSLLAMNDEFGRSDGLADVINLLAAPIAGGIRAVEQIRRGADELLRTIENLNRTMENLNETATRVNRLVGDIEEPIRAMIPQITRSVQAADEMAKLLEAPVRAAAPNIERMVDVLSSPGFATLPNQLGDFMGAVSEMSKRLAPLTSFAENAGGLFGGFRMPGSGGQRSTTPSPTPTAPVAKTITTTPGARATTAAKKAAPKKSAAKKAATKKPVAKKAAPKKSAAKKAATKKPA